MRPHATMDMLTYFGLSRLHHTHTHTVLMKSQLIYLLKGYKFPPQEVDISIILDPPVADMRFVILLQENFRLNHDIIY